MVEKRRVRRRRHVGVITLNRPEARNALTFRPTPSSRTRCARRRRALPRHHRRRPGVLLGRRREAGHGRRRRQRRPSGRLEPRLTPAAEALLHTDVPVIAAVNGAAVGWGMELALMADIRVASERAKFGELFVLRGLSATSPGLGRLAPLVGRERRRRAAVHRRRHRRRRGARIGLVSRVVPHASCSRRRWRWPPRSPPTRRSPCSASRRGCARRSTPTGTASARGSPPTSPSKRRYSTITDSKIVDP